jgi:hypothetical protein
MGSHMNKKLSPAQQNAFDQLLQVLPKFHILGLTANSGAGKTTVLQEIHQRTGGVWICMRELLHALRSQHPLAIEETFEQIVEAAFKSADHVYVTLASPATSTLVKCSKSRSPI